MPGSIKSKLPRLTPEHYRGRAVVFWTHTVEHRGAGWLNPLHHATFRELLFHAASREVLLCPAYTMMPDHVHVVWMGVAETSDQRAASAFLRTKFEPRLAPRRWQHQPHDHVLREEERKRGAFGATCQYVSENPVRAGLVSKAEDWPFAGSLIPGYPDLRLGQDGFWELFWRIYNACAERGWIGKL